MTGGDRGLDTAPKASGFVLEPKALSRARPLPQAPTLPVGAGVPANGHDTDTHPRRPSCPARVAPCFSITSPWTWAISTSRP
ncbi:protein of unknown function [Pseudomonas sp. JV551A1]|uniref:Uncharacterized protein n=1 Tax=Pseudomonas inefficax TaxID=2078786 RepID=A0AAQ1P7P0_9PSED|nr:protein of unknown function [Pseudomonas sp. JV551A1]SPO59330.1 protein of unknown function [Pseudomonas inefficax]